LYHLLVGGLFFQAISKKVKGMAINPVAIRIGCIIAGSNDLPIAIKYGNGYTPAVKNQKATNNNMKGKLRLRNLYGGFFILSHLIHLFLS
jgi:hypothetical protein